MAIVEKINQEYKKTIGFLEENAETTKNNLNEL